MPQGRPLPEKTRSHPNGRVQRCYAGNTVGPLPDLERASLLELNRLAGQLSRGHVLPGWLNAQQLRLHVVSALDNLALADAGDYELADDIAFSELDPDTPVVWSNAGLLHSVISTRNASVHGHFGAQAAYSTPINQGIVFEAPQVQAAIFQTPPVCSVAWTPEEQFPDSFIIVEIPEPSKRAPSHFRAALLELILRRADRLFKQQLRVFGGLTRVHEFLLSHFSWHLVHGAHPPDVPTSSAFSFSA